MRRAGESSALLRAVDALCADLQRTCGVTRLSVVLDRVPRPLTVTLQNEFHVVTRARGSARLTLELRDGDRRLGEVVLEDALAYVYPAEMRGVAGDVLARHARALSDVMAS